MSLSVDTTQTPGDTKMKVELLKLAADILRTRVDEKQFAMSQWGFENKCGFAGCALGHLTQHSEFKELGLHFCDESLCIKFMGQANLYAAMRLFGLTKVQSASLFLPTSYAQWEWENGRITPEIVAKRIDDLILNDRRHEDES
jgi:hypothetical protein